MAAYHDGSGRLAQSLGAGSQEIIDVEPQQLRALAPPRAPQLHAGDPNGSVLIAGTTGQIRLRTRSRIE